ncbi:MULTISPECIES: pitrilysin family protein [unclassified Imperialibacter]|uniref:M16 family metallopeptidase n=1 Tax=unclassified Imperialibacter TaxID=2629706 RepID=UPI00125ACC9F|nr:MULTISPECIES: pitrilysin family protein [unclassified Imperialibacter]CAD5293047.1 Predicted Zn-dependent peptidase [Imperialibacter sp. 89]CAD5294106.1 Predicted Zn-dependent peptidase [Imperialibacter sp. 75]VVT18570.1 Predicted Zn-dependent peptidase [Imperialibacter sp. EC-SDR9]
MLDRTAAPEFHIPTRTDLKHVTSSTLDNGIQFHELILGDQEVCRIEIVLRSGNWFEEKEGVSYFTTKMLLEGTEKLSGRQIADKLDYYGAYWEATSGMDFVTLTVYSLTKYLEEVVPFFLSVVVDASFPEKELETIKKVRIQQIRVNKQKTSALASSGLRHLLFGQSHPYGKELSEEEVGKVTSADLKEYHKNRLWGQAEVFVSGKLSSEELSKLKGFFGDFPSRAVSLPNYPVVTAPAVREILPVNESVQASLRLGKTAHDKHHPDHYHLMLLNEVFGGYFGSRLMKNIREDKGYTYGIYSSLSYLQNAAFWVVGTDVKREVAIASIDEILKEMRLLRTEPVPSEELETVKNYMIGTFLSSISTSFSLMDKFRSIHFAGLDYEYYNRLLTSIRTATSEDLLRVANDSFKEEDWLQVVAGGI